MVANEGEPEGYCAGQVDPRGSVSVIDLRAGGSAASVRTAGFGRWDGREDFLRRSGARIFGPGATASQDIEPEYVAVGRHGARAWVTLQEKNALAVVNLRRARVTDIVSLGTVNHSVRGSGFDASDEDGGVGIRPRPVRGFAMPDGADARSDAKGPEPEGIEIGRIRGRTYAFVGLERISGLVVLDVTEPRSPRLVRYADNRDPAGDPEAGTAGNLGPEGLHFVSAADSPNGAPLLLVGNEASGTTTSWQVDVH